MKTILKNDKMIVFLNKKEIDKITFSDKENLEEYFKTVFNKINKNYDIDINGYYNIDIYLDDNYGAILEIENEDLDYYNYFNQIDMKLNISKKTSFLYEIKYEFIDSMILKNSICYKYLDKLYLKIEQLEETDYLKLIEFSNIIYGSEKDNIIKYGKKVNL